MDWVGFFIWGWGLSFTLYVLAQIVVPLFLRGSVALIALLPIPLMAWIAFSATQAYQQHSNLWPIWLILVSPFALGYLLLIGFGLLVAKGFRAYSDAKSRQRMAIDIEKN